MVFLARTTHSVLASGRRRHHWMDGWWSWQRQLISWKAAAAHSKEECLWFGTFFPSLYSSIIVLKALLVSRKVSLFSFSEISTCRCNVSVCVYLSTQNSTLLLKFTQTWRKYHQRCYRMMIRAAADLSSFWEQSIAFVKSTALEKKSKHEVFHNLQSAVRRQRIVARHLHCRRPKSVLQSCTWAAHEPYSVDKHLHWLWSKVGIVRQNSRYRRAHCLCICVAKRIGSPLACNVHTTAYYIGGNSNQVYAISLNNNSTLQAPSLSTVRWEHSAAVFAQLEWLWIWLIHHLIHLVPLVALPILYNGAIVVCGGLDTGWSKS